MARHEEPGRRVKDGADEGRERRFERQRDGRRRAEVSANANRVKKEKAWKGGGCGRRLQAVRGWFNSPRGINSEPDETGNAPNQTSKTRCQNNDAIPRGKTDGKDVRRDHTLTEGDTLFAPQSFPILWWLDHVVIANPSISPRSCR